MGFPQNFFAGFSRLGGSAGLIKRVLVEQLPHHWMGYAVSSAFVATMAACTAAAAYIVSTVVNSVYVSADLGATVTTCLLVIGIFVVRGLATYGQAVTLATISSTIAADYQVRLFDKFTRQNIAYLAENHSTQLNSTIAFAGGSVGAVLSTLINVAGRDILTLLGLAGVMIAQDPWLSLACLLILPAVAFTVFRARERVKQLTREQFASSVAIYEIGQETMQGIRVVKAFGLEDLLQRKFRDAVMSVRNTVIKVVRASNRSGPMMEALGGIAVALLVMYGAYRVLRTGTAPGELFSFATAFLLAYEPVKRLARVHIDLAAGLVGVQMLFSALDASEGEAGDARQPPLVVDRGEIEFRDVSFGYRFNEPVLRNLSFRAQPQKITALVGVSGGGKSTVFNLLLRFYDPASGAIVVDNQDIRDASRASLRKQIAYVGQDSFLFRASIRDNIALGKMDATEDEIVAAAKAAFAHDFIADFPQGYQTPVGEHGQQLSTGQRQRIAIARALIRDARIVLLDEPTAALDSESEHQVHEAISRLCKGRTTMVIAHRFHTIANADLICVVEDGAIVESGSYAELMAQQGRFAAFARLQFRDEAA